MRKKYICESAEAQLVRQLILHAARVDDTVLILGDTGTGKEVVARAIHDYSRRQSEMFTPVNCGGIPRELLESELFGHEKGSFTGALYTRKGKLELADGGTLFLDEVGTISLKTQVELLRVLETKEFTRLGGSRPIQVDFRVVCATNQNLEKQVEEGHFREDLYYRLNVFSIYLPPLREHASASSAPSTRRR